MKAANEPFARRAISARERLIRGKVGVSQQEWGSSHGMRTELRLTGMASQACSTFSPVFGKRSEILLPSGNTRGVNDTLISLR